MEQNFSLATTEQTTAAVEVMDGNHNFIADLTTRAMQYCSMVAETDSDKAKLYNAMNNPEKRVGDCINEQIAIKDVYVEIVNCTNRETGEVTTCPRVVLIDVNGVGYQAVSLGVFSALKKIFAVFGEPNEWYKPLTVKVKQLTKGERKMLTLDIVCVGDK